MLYFKDGGTKVVCKTCSTTLGQKKPRWIKSQCLNPEDTDSLSAPVRLQIKKLHNLRVFLFSIRISIEPQPSHVAVSAIKSIKQHQGFKPGNTQNQLEGPSLLALTYHLRCMNK